jgi:hypothetical protein
MPLVVCVSASAQSTDLRSKDESGIYKHALDSAISLIQKEKPLRVLYISGLECVLNYLPDTLQHVAIISDQKRIRKKEGKLKPDELVLIITCAQLVDNGTVVMIFSPQPSEWSFAFGYQFNPVTKEPKLLYVNRGPLTIEFK